MDCYEKMLLVDDWVRKSKSRIQSEGKTQQDLRELIQSETGVDKVTQGMLKASLAKHGIARLSKPERELAAIASKLEKAMDLIKLLVIRDCIPPDLKDMIVSSDKYNDELKSMFTEKVC